MISLADYEFDEVPLSETVMRVLANVRLDFPAEQVRQQLANLVEEAKEDLRDIKGQELQLEQLLKLFFTQWGFGAAKGVYQFSDTIWLDKVLDTREGAPVTLGIILLHLAEELDLPLMPVIFPTQLILRADWLDEEMWLINPLNGETLSEHLLEVWLKGHIGANVSLEDEDLDEAENVTIIRKLLGTLKGALMQEEQLELALQSSELLLTFDQTDPYEIRDRGLIYAQLDCNNVAINDLNYFVEQCPDDPVAEVIKIQIHSIEERDIILH